MQPRKDRYARIKTTLTQRCDSCRKFIQGDPWEHLRLYHGGQGAIEEPGAVDYANPQIQAPIPSVAPPAPNQQTKPIPNPFLQQYAADQVPVTAPINDFMVWNFQHPVIAERKAELDLIEGNIKQDAIKLKERNDYLADERQKLVDAANLYRKSGGMMRPVRPNSFEGIKAAFTESTGIELSLPVLLTLGAVLYMLVVFFDVPNKLWAMWTPLISKEGRRLLEARGQSAKTPEEYITLTKNQWIDIHRGLEALDVLGNEKIPVHKLGIKTSLMDHFQNSTLDRVFIVLHKASDVIEQCRGLVTVAKYDKNGFTDAFVRCYNDRMP